MRYVSEILKKYFAPIRLPLLKKLSNTRLVDDMNEESLIHYR